MGYLNLRLSPETADLVRNELNSQLGTGVTIPDDDPAESKAQAIKLERKWVAVVRLQRQVLDLEKEVNTLKVELENAPKSSIRRGQDPTNWLPQKPAKHTLSGHRESVTSVAFHPTFSVLASCCEDGSIKIWDWEFGELERTLKGHTKTALDADFGGPPGEVLLATCSSDLNIKLWDPQADYDNIRTLTGHDHTVSCVRFTPSGIHLISGSRDHDIRIWEVKTGYSIRTIQGHSDWVKSVCPSFDGSYILSTSTDQSARVSNLQTGEGRLSLIGHSHVVLCAAFAPTTSYTHLAQIEGLQRPVESSFSPSFEYLATGSRDKTIKIWNTRAEVITTLVGHDNWVRDLTFHPGGKFLISVSDDKSIRMWDLTQNGRCTRVISDAHNHFINTVRWAPSLRSTNGPETNNNHNSKSNNVDSEIKGMRCVIATGSADKDIKIWM